MAELPGKIPLACGRCDPDTPPRTAAVSSRTGQGPGGQSRERASLRGSSGRGEAGWQAARRGKAASPSITRSLGGTHDAGNLAPLPTVPLEAFDERHVFQGCPSPCGGGERCERLDWCVEAPATADEGARRLAGKRGGLTCVHAAGQGLVGVFHCSKRNRLRLGGRTGGDLKRRNPQPVRPSSAGRATTCVHDQPQCRAARHSSVSLMAADIGVAVELHHAIGFAGGVRDAVRWTPDGEQLVWPAGAVAGESPKGRPSAPSASCRHA